MESPLSVRLHGSHYASYRLLNQYLQCTVWSEIFWDLFLRSRQLCNVPGGCGLVSSSECVYLGHLLSTG